MVESSDAAAWPEVSPEVERVIREMAGIALEMPSDLVDELNAAALSGERMRPIAADPTLAAALMRTNVANVRHWAVANIQYPGKRVPPNLGPEPVASARDLVRRGLSQAAMEIYRLIYRVIWKRCMEVAFTLTDDHETLAAVLDVVSVSITTFIEDTAAAIAEFIAAEYADLTEGTQAERRAAVALLLEGAPIPHDRAERQLGYRLTGPHTAAVLWSLSPSVGDELEVAAESLMKATNVSHRLTVVSTASSMWVWLPTDYAVDLNVLRADLDLHPELHVAVGRPNRGLDGFRRSHLDALATQRMLTRLASPQRSARYEDVQLVAILSTDQILCDEFVREVLGGLAHPDERDVRHAVLTYLKSNCNIARTAEAMYTHRNTVVRRLARADELLPQPLEGNAVAIGAALEVLRWTE